ncbi:MAG: hypothetical protein ACE5LU_02785 [Anaerolineae bacterium]
MSRLVTPLLLLVLFAGVLMLPAPPTASLAQANPLEACEGGAFSTEEDFMMLEGEPFDGDPYISDGDLLSSDGQVCARNADLLAAFYAATAPPADLGLDAADILGVTDRLVAFSTSLDDPFGKFTAGDLLFTNGAIIPNSALVAPFGITHDIGLDAVHFVGTSENIRQFVNRAREVDPGQWGTDLLKQLLESFSLDIWFSIEGTHRVAGAASILDGDLLSATGAIVASNSALLPPGVPAGIPQRGVDFGLDAVTARRLPGQEPFIQFSTEILYRGELSFTDGDVLVSGNGIVVTNEDLIQFFHPAADFLGLDALYGAADVPPPQDPNIQTMCGDHSAVDFDGGMVSIGDPGTGLYRDNPSAAWPAGRPRRPCGEYVPIDGFLPNVGVNRFRVAYRPAGDPAPAVGTALGIRTNWSLRDWRWFPAPGCYDDASSPSLNTDANGWMDAANYLTAADGTLTGCANSGLRLAVWDTANHQPGFGPADKDGHYVLWLEWEDGGGVLHREPFDHHLQLDNTLPVINDLLVTLNDGTTPVAACGEAPTGESIFKVHGDFADDYYWGYRLRVRGGDPPASQYYGWHNYYDGTLPVANTDDTGTTPDGSTVYLRDIDMTDLGESFTDCCYVLDLWVRDAAIRHSFNGRVANNNSGSSAWWDNVFITFAAAP